jgi:bacteriocin biosynthesis cyclodehydratase domain-containing protein
MPRLLLLHDGRFGDAVGERLARRFPGLDARGLLRSRGSYAALAAAADFVAVASWRRHEPELDELDDACWRAGVPWSRAVLDERWLFGGPLVVPGRGACYRCFVGRCLSHHAAPERELVVRRAYQADPALGPRGFTAPAVGMAAGLLAADATAGPEAAGRVVRVDLVTAETTDSRVVRVHGCDRCGGPRDAVPGARFTARLVPAVKELLR